MADLLYVVVTLLVFGGLAVGVGVLARRLDEPADRADLPVADEKRVVGSEVAR